MPTKCKAAKRSAFAAERRSADALQFRRNTMLDGVLTFKGFRGGEGVVTGLA